MSSNVLEGIFGGATTGAGAGMTIGGPPGAIVGGIVGALAGGFSGANTDSAMSAARKATIPVVTPEEQWYLNGVKRRRKQMELGTDAASAFAINNVKDVLGNTQANILRDASGNTATGISGLLAAQHASNRTIQGIGANAANNALRLGEVEGALVQNQANREREQAEYRRDLLYSEFVNGKQNLNNLFSTGIALAPEIGNYNKGILDQMERLGMEQYSGYKNLIDNLLKP